MVIAPAPTYTLMKMRQAGALKLLIAEDEVTLRRVICTIVAGLASEIRNCVLPGELEQAYTAWEPDFVLIDADMSTLEAITATQAIRAVNPSANVILISGYDSPELREAAARAGAMAYVMKEDLLEIGRLLVLHR
jgi:CheY-like chemotaxis protein